MLNVLCHELLHARFPDLEEESIEDMGTLLAESYEEMEKMSSYVLTK
jgi:hypothetical protein